VPVPDRPSSWCRWQGSSLGFLGPRPQPLPHIAATIGKSGWRRVSGRPGQAAHPGHRQPWRGHPKSCRGLVDGQLVVRVAGTGDGQLQQHGGALVEVVAVRLLGVVVQLLAGMGSQSPVEVMEPIYYEEAMMGPLIEEGLVEQTEPGPTWCQGQATGADRGISKIPCAVRKPPPWTSKPSLRRPASLRRAVFSCRYLIVRNQPAVFSRGATHRVA
jgi:hypothetical protein